MDLTDSIKCSGCQTVNKLSAKYCSKCGRPISSPTKKCKVCGNLSDVGSAFCNTCGIAFSEAKLGVTSSRAIDWEIWFRENFPFYRQIWSKEGIGQKFRIEGRKILDHNFPDRKIQKPAFMIPIMSKDWLIQNIDVDGEKVTNGLFYGLEQELRIVNISNGHLWRFPYEDISHYEFSEGWKMEFLTHQKNKIKLQVKVPNTTGAKVSLVANILFGISHDSPISREATHQNNQRVISDLNEKFEMADKFWGGVVSFLNEVYSHL